jgi:MFS family permease
MFCEQCGCHGSDTALFCYHCGAGLHVPEKQAPAESGPPNSYSVAGSVGGAAQTGGTSGARADAASAESAPGRQAQTIAGHVVENRASPDASTATPPVAASAAPSQSDARSSASKESEAQHPGLRSRLWRLAAFAGFGAGGGYVLWEAVFNTESSGHEPWTWDVWLVTVIGICLTVLFLVAGFESLEHRLRHGKWPSREHNPVRMGKVVLRGQAISIGVALSIHLYLSMVLHRPEVAVEWASQFAVFTALIYAWASAVITSAGTAQKTGARAGQRWGFWSTLIGIQISTGALLVGGAAPAQLMDFLRKWYDTPVTSSGGNVLLSFVIALLMGITFWVFFLVMSFLAALWMRICGSLGGRAVEYLKRGPLNMSLISGTSVFCLMNLAATVIYIFFVRNIAAPTIGYSSALLQYALVAGGASLGILIAPPLTPAAKSSEGQN